MFRAPLSCVLAVFLSVTLAGTCRADFTFQTPDGINPGESFNLVFYDSIGYSATSANIADYNAAITSAASNIVYSGGTIGAWSIIGATSSADESAGLFESNLPVYDLSGNLLAATGGTYISIGPSPSIDQTGSLFPAYPAWTGLISLGIPGNSQYNLGGGFWPSYGLSGYPPPADGWGGLMGGSTENYSPADKRGLYGYAVLTASPEPTWLAPVSGNWSLGSNWSLGAAPNSPGAVAIFNKATTADLTITLDAPQTVGSLTFGNSASNSVGYILSGSNALTLNNSGGDATIKVTGGSQGINIPVVLASNLVVTTSPGNTNALTLSFGTASDISQSGSGSFSLTMNGTGGELILGGTDTYTGGTSVEAGTLIVTSKAALANGSNLTVGNDTSLLGPISAGSSANPDLLPGGTNAVPEPDTLLLAFAAAVVANVCFAMRRRDALPAGPIRLGGPVSDRIAEASLVH
jgi:autotransporter-associated beta strand protein